MADPQIVTTLRNKAEGIERHVLGLEKQLARARADLAHVRATLALFEATGDTPQYPVHMGVHRLFRRGEIWSICNPVLDAAPNGLDTRELALAVIEAKGLDPADKVFRSSVSLAIVHIMRMRELRGHVKRLGKRKGVVLWQLAR